MQTVCRSLYFLKKDEFANTDLAYLICISAGFISFLLTVTICVGSGYVRHGKVNLPPVFHGIYIKRLRNWAY